MKRRNMTTRWIQKHVWMPGLGSSTPKVQKQTHRAHRAHRAHRVITGWIVNSGAKDVSTRTQKKGICACGGKWHGSTSLPSLGVRQKGCRTKGAFTESTTGIDRHIFILVQWCSFWRNTLLGQGARGLFSKTGSRISIKARPPVPETNCRLPLAPSHTSRLCMIFEVFVISSVQHNKTITLGVPVPTFHSAVCPGQEWSQILKICWRTGKVDKRIWCGRLSIQVFRTILNIYIYIYYIFHYFSTCSILFNLTQSDSILLNLIQS